MDIKVRTNISKEFNDIEIDINAPEKNEEVQRIENYLLTETAKSINTILGMQDNNIFIIDTQEIITVFGEGKTNYCKTKNGRYRIKEKLYYLEEVLPTKQFIRISNSCIVNVKKVKCFDVSLVGRMVIKLEDGSSEIVSRRRISEIMKFLKERCD